MTDDAKAPRRELLEEAADLIDGDRNVSYGTPTQNFTNIAEMWTTRLRHKLKDDEEFTATDVADLMILLKIARNIANVKKDTYADVAGYAGCGYEAMLKEQPQPPVPESKVDFHMTTGDGFNPDLLAADIRRHRGGPHYK